MFSPLTWRRALIAPTVALVVFAGLTVSTEQVAHAQSTEPPPPAGTSEPGTAPKPPEPPPAAPAPEENKAPAAPSDAATKDAKAQAEASTPTPATPAADEEEKEANHAVYLSADVAFTRTDLGGFSDSTGFDKTGANGVSYGFGVGYRHHDWRFGGRFRANDTTEFNIWSLMLEVGYGLNLRPIQPVFLFHAGYVFDTRIDRPVFASSLPSGNILTPDVDVRGAVVGLEVVGSYWFTKFARLGPFVGFDMMFLRRSQADLPQSLFPISDETRQKALFSDTGSSVGYIFNVGIRGTADIGW